MPEDRKVKPEPPAESSQGFVTVAEASERWGVPARRVRHVLERSAKRGEAPPETFHKTFRTRTGERSAVAYPLAWLGALLEADSPQVETLQHSEGERSANEAKQSAEPFQQSAPERSEGDDGAGDWRARALVAEARAELLEAERDRLDKSLTEALAIARAAQDAERSARLIGQRSAMQIEAVSSTLDSSQSSPEGSGEGIVPPDPGKRPFWAFWKKGG